MHHPVTHFAYPNGDFDDAVVTAVRESEFQTAVTALLGMNTTYQDPFLLKRRPVATTFPHYYFQETLNGLHW